MAATKFGRRGLLATFREKRWRNRSSGVAGGESIIRAHRDERERGKHTRKENSLLSEAAHAHADDTAAGLVILISSRGSTGAVSTCEDESRDEVKSSKQP
eukprot:5321199-Pleurochrysis_carterae.AAC.2